MTRRDLLRLAEGVLTIPTAPFHEQGVRQFVIDYCQQRGLHAESDKVGNLIVRYRHKHSGPPLVLMAHMDHPGFEALGGNQAEFLGGVPKEMLRPGGRIRFFTLAGVVRKRITRRIDRQWPLHKLIGLDNGRGLARGDFGMWDVPAFVVKGDRLRATAIDDVLSVAVLLATLTELTRQRIATHVWCVFTRAEEVGFPGAIEVARARLIPRDALVVSMEMSKERPWARMGDGPVVRVGDRMSVFDGLAAYFLCEVGRGLQRRDPQYRYQRALMDGGSCEATAFAGFGYRVAGLCLPLGNYHNIGPGKRPRAEYVCVRDLAGLVRLTVAASQQWREFKSAARHLQARVMKIRREMPRKLTAIR